MSRRAKIDEVSTPGKFGQTINVGETVAFLTFSQGLSSTGTGTYKGLVNSRAQIEEDYTFQTRHHPETGEDLSDWNKFTAYAETIVGKQPPYPRWQNSSQYAEDRKVYDAFTAKRNAVYNTLVFQTHSAKRIRRLQLNFMFRLEK